MNKIKVFETNQDGKIEFTAQELEKQLNAIYSEGYSEGYREGISKVHTITYQHPYFYNAKDISNPAVTISTRSSNNSKLNTEVKPQKYAEKIDKVFYNLAEELKDDET